MTGRGGYNDHNMNRNNQGNNNGHSSDGTFSKSISFDEIEIITRILGPRGGGFADRGGE